MLWNAKGEDRGGGRVEDGGENKGCTCRLFVVPSGKIRIFLCQLQQGFD